jgi:hypothetical protein
MTILSLLVVAGLSTSAQAGDGPSVRLKVNSDLFQIQNMSMLDADGEAVDDSGDSDSKTTTVGFFQGAPRFEATYIITPNIEAGIILGYSNVASEIGGEATGSQTGRRIGLTGSYNFKLGDGLRGYAQPVLVSGKGLMKDDEGETLGGMSSLSYGLNAGLRVRLVKGATFDPGFEYMMGNVKTLDDAGEVVEDAGSMKVSNFGLKAGISVAF